MAKKSAEGGQLQEVKSGKNAVVVGRDYVSSTKVNIWMPLFIMSVLVIGGLAWALNAGLLKDSGNPQQTSEPGSAEEIINP
ncbi:MAG: hypothetical protein AAFX78_17855 [Cyanobacteria bacterium J06638_20]